MSVSEKLKDFLDQNKIKYNMISHSKAYTAQELANKMHISGLEIAKVVIVKTDGRFAMAVMPAPHHIDFDRFKEASGVKSVELATEKEFKNLFPDCEVGAMPPFGNLYGLPVYVAKPLEEDEYIVFNAGSHTEAIRMEYGEFKRLAKPVVIEYTSARK